MVMLVVVTTTSIKKAQRYYDLLKRVVAGETPVQINEEIRKVVPDFPKFAITYSVTENEEESTANQDKMKEALKDYNETFGTHYTIDQLGAYNRNLNDRLARKMDKYKARNQQLDLVIVVDRLLTGFDAPCLSTLFVDRPPMQPHDIIQAMSRTNRLLDKLKEFGQIVTFQTPKQFKTAVDDAVKLFSAGGIGEALAGDWEETERNFIVALADLRALVPTPGDAALLSQKEKKRFVRLFQRFDSLLTQLRAFTDFYDNGSRIDEYGITQAEYEDYAAHYRNIIEELRGEGGEGEEGDGEPGPPVDTDYEPMAYSCVKIDYEYILSLIQDIVSDEDTDEEEFRAKVAEVRGYIAEFSESNRKVGAMLAAILDGIEKDKGTFVGRNISEILSDMKKDALNKVVDNFVKRWFVDREAVMFAVYNHINGVIPNASVLKDSLRYSEYRDSTEGALKKPKARTQMIAELEDMIQEEIVPLEIGAGY